MDGMDLEPTRRDPRRSRGCGLQGEPGLGTGPPHGNGALTASRHGGDRGFTQEAPDLQVNGYDGLADPSEESRGLPSPFQVVAPSFNRA